MKGVVDVLWEAEKFMAKALVEALVMLAFVICPVVDQKVGKVA